MLICAFAADAGKPDLHMSDIARHLLQPERCAAGPVEVGDFSAFPADEVPVWSGPGVVACRIDLVQPPDDSLRREFIENPVDALPGDCGLGGTNRGPDRIHIRMREVAGQKFIYRQPLRGAFPADLPADFQKFFPFVVPHDIRYRSFDFCL